VRNTPFLLNKVQKIFVHSVAKSSDLKMQGLWSLFLTKCDMQI